VTHDFKSFGPWLIGSVSWACGEPACHGREFSVGQAALTLAWNQGRRGWIPSKSHLVKILYLPIRP
jgi:hypothetical protein